MTDVELSDSSARNGGGLGGGFALLSADRGFDAMAPNHGQPPSDLDIALAGACPVVGSYGGSDRTLKAARAEREAASTKAGVVHDLTEYPGAGHQFLDDAETGPRPLRPLFHSVGMGPDPEAAAAARSRIDGSFGEHLR